jgi:hypothetical protein
MTLASDPIKQTRTAVTDEDLDGLWERSGDSDEGALAAAFHWNKAITSN